MRLGLVVGASTATLAGTAGLSVSDPSGARLAEIPAGEVWRVAVGGPGLVMLAPGGAATGPSEVLEIASPDSEALVQVNGHPYRGSITAVRDRTGLTVVDRVPMEAYLVGVVSAEMGRRAPGEQEALRAQAIVSRTLRAIAKQCMKRSAVRNRTLRSGRRSRRRWQTAFMRCVLPSPAWA